MSAQVVPILSTPPYRNYAGSTPHRAWGEADLGQEIQCVSLRYSSYPGRYDSAFGVGIGLRY